MDINKIGQNYNPAWKGETSKGQEKRIYAITGEIKETTYTRLIDSEGVYIDDKDKEAMMIIKRY